MNQILLTLYLFLIHQSSGDYIQDNPEISISSPAENQFVQGQVVVTGNVTVLGLSYYELSFAHSNDPTQTWFVLHSGSSSVYEGELGIWDTTTLTDGDYDLRLEAILLDGTEQQTSVSRIRVRNYTPIPTSTPEPTGTPVSQFAPPTAQLITNVPPTITHALPTPTNLGKNPAEVEIPAIAGTLGKGALITLLFILGIALMLRLRRD